jgi:hypothetical protein
VDTEDEACTHLLKLLRGDPTTHFHLVVGPLPAREADDAFGRWREAHGSDNELEASDVRVDNPIFTPEQGRVRRYWVRGTKLPGR